MSASYIKIWRFHDAPKKYQNLSQNEGDEDWIALIPPHLADEYIGWLDSGGGFGGCFLGEFKIRDGRVV